MKVSVIVPYTTNRGWLDEAIESIEGQDYSGEIEYILSQSEAGVSHNINEGFKECTGDIIRWLSEDDKLTANSISASVKYFEANPTVDFFHSQSHIINPAGQITDTFKPRYTPFTASELAAKNYIHGGTVVYKRKCFETALYNTELWTGEEYEYNMRLLSLGFNLGYLPEVTYMYRKHEHQKSARSNRNLQRRIVAIKEIKALYR